MSSEAAVSSYDLYIKTPPRRLFFTVAVPGAISMVVSSLWGLFDGVFVGQFLGEQAFAAVNLAFPLMLINFSLADLIGVGSSVPISIAMGRRQEQEASNYFTCACIMIVATGILMGAAFYAAAPALLSLMGAEGELRDLAAQYIRVYAVCSPVTTIVFAVDNFLRICGRIKSSMFLNILMSALIMGLELLCLSVLDMGIGGSALAVSCGMFLCALVALWPFWRGRLPLRFCRPRFSARLIRQVVSSGSPTFLNNTAARLASILMNAVLLRAGGQNALNVYGVLMYAGDIVQQLLYGACDSLQPAIGYNWGAGQVGRVKSIIKCCMAAGAAISVGGAAVMLLFPRQITQLFLSEGGSDLVAMSIHALRLFSLAYLTRWFGFAVQSFLIALDKPLPATVLSLANAFVFPVGLIVVLWPLGLDGLWLNVPITSTLVAGIALAILLRMKGLFKALSEQ